MITQEELDAGRGAVASGEKEEAWRLIERWNQDHLGEQYTPAVAAFVRRGFERRWAERWPS